MLSFEFLFVFSHLDWFCVLICVYVMHHAVCREYLPGLHFPKQFLMASVWDVDCFAELRQYILSLAVANTETRTLVARRVTEVAQSTLDMVSTAVDYPLCECYQYTLSVWIYTRVWGDKLQFFLHILSFNTGFVKGVARPDYWIPDHEITQCHCCAKRFIPSMSKHHCRACGQGVCGNCSSKNRPVPSRGWDHPVRVCNDCADRNDSLWRPNTAGISWCPEPGCRQFSSLRRNIHGWGKYETHCSCIDKHSGSSKH